MSLGSSSTRSSRNCSVEAIPTVVAFSIYSAFAIAPTLSLIARTPWRSSGLQALLRPCAKGKPALWRADAKGNIVEFNARFAEVYGWAEGQLVGESISAILPPSFREFHHAGFARFQLTESSSGGASPHPGHGLQ